MLDEALHFHHDGLFHLGAGNFAGQHGALAALILLRRRSLLCFCGHYAFPAFFVLLERSADFLAGLAAADVFAAACFAGAAAVFSAVFSALFSVPFFEPAVPFNSWARKCVLTRARSLRASRKRFSASACPVDNWNRSRKICSVNSLSCTSSCSLPASRIFSMRRGILHASCASHELRGDRQLVGRQRHGFLGGHFVHARHFKHDAAGLHYRNPLFRSTFAFAHAGFRRLLSEGLVRENSDPQLSATLDEARNRYARSFNLAVGDPRALERLQTVLAKRQIAAAPGFAGAPPAHLLPVLHLLGHQHRYVLASLISFSSCRFAPRRTTLTLPRSRALFVLSKRALERFHLDKPSTSRQSRRKWYSPSPCRNRYRREAFAAVSGPADTTLYARFPRHSGARL